MTARERSPRDYRLEAERKGNRQILFLISIVVFRGRFHAAPLFCIQKSENLYLVPFFLYIVSYISALNFFKNSLQEALEKP